MKIDGIRLGVTAMCQFAVRSKHNFNAAMLEQKLQEQSKFIIVNGEGMSCDIYRYKITFPISVLPLADDLTIQTIMNRLDKIEQEVEEALRIKELMEMIE